jgi:hypothetical protein
LLTKVLKVSEENEPAAFTKGAQDVEGDMVICLLLSPRIENAHGSTDSGI